LIEPIQLFIFNVIGAVKGRTDRNRREREGERGGRRGDEVRWGEGGKDK
jgi:hypothetical protein